MNKLLILTLYSLVFSNLVGQNLHISGNFSNVDESTLVFYFKSDPLTSQKDEFITPIDKDGSFQFNYEVNAPRKVTLRIGENPNLIGHFFVFPNSNIHISADCHNFKETLRFSGDYQKLTSIRNQLFTDYFKPDTVYFTTESQDWDQFEDNLNIFIQEKLTLLNHLSEEYSLSKTEYNYAWAEIYCRFFYSYLSNILKLKIPLDDQVYSFYDLLDFNNDSIALFNNDYNNYVEFALMYKYRKQNNLLSERSISDSSFFFNQYEFGKNHLSNIVRDVFLTRLLFRVLNQGVPGADQLYSQYLADCKMAKLRTIIKQEYSLYLLAKNKETKVNYVIIENPEEDLNDFLMNYKGKVLLLEYWGSWCSPCIKAIPRVKIIEEQFKPEEFQIIHIAVGDTYDRMKFAIEKYNINGVNILLPRSTELKWKTRIDNYTVPYYAIINRNGEIIEDAPLGYFTDKDIIKKLREVIKQY